MKEEQHSRFKGGRKAVANRPIEGGTARSANRRVGARPLWWIMILGTIRVWIAGALRE